jgi:hypothetical protein
MPDEKKAVTTKQGTSDQNRAQTVTTDPPKATDQQLQQPQQQQQEVILPPPIPQEEFDHNDMFARRKLPRIYHGKGSSDLVIADETRYVITDIAARSSQDINKVIWTQIYASIYPLSQLEPMIVEDGNIKYSVLAGSGSVTIENVSKPIEKHNIFVVEKGVTHSIINTSRDQPLVILIDYSGTDILDLRELYKPLEQMTKRAQITRERVMNVQQPKQEQQQSNPKQTPGNNQTATTNTTFNRQKVKTEDVYV